MIKIYKQTAAIDILSEPLVNYMLFCLVDCSELWENCDLFLKQTKKSWFLIISEVRETEMSNKQNVLSNKKIGISLTLCAKAPSGFEYKWNIHCTRVFTSHSWPHHCLYWIFLGNICIYSHVIELVTHMLDCYDLASAGHYWMMRIRGDLEVGIRNADW